MVVEVGDITPVIIIELNAFINNAKCFELQSVSPDNKICGQYNCSINKDVTPIHCITPMIYIPIIIIIQLQKI